MKNLNILFAGFGGQGVLFAGKVVAYAALIANKQLSWLPSYGPEMRGGTANCSVCVSDEAIGSPLVTNPNVFVEMCIRDSCKDMGDRSCQLSILQKGTAAHALYNAACGLQKPGVRHLDHQVFCLLL